MITSKLKYILSIVILIINNKSFAHEQISNLITPVSYFVNHVKQLSLLKDNLIKYRKASIVGTSGIGKTQLVRMYIYENKHNYNVIWFFDCNLDLNQEFVKLAKQINQTAKTSIPEDGKLAKKGVRDYLSHQDKWVLIFDNLRIGDNQKIKDIINWENNGQIIFCSQDSEILPHIVKMTIFNNNDAITLANSILENKDQELAEFLADAFKGYPVLIVQGAQLLNMVKGLNKEEYKNKIKQSADKIKLNINLAINELTPSAVSLLNRIALINNQSFSKQFLSLITNNISNFSDDIYQISKLMLISASNSDKVDPIFEMHDVIQQKILEINGHKDNKQYLEKIIVKLMDAIPKNVIKGRIFRNTRTIRENMEIILKNTQKYNIDIYKVMELSFHVLNSYLNIFDYYNAEKLVDWFNKNDKQKNFNQLLMNNNEKRIYAGYLGLIGGYYKSRYSDYSLTLQYYIRAKQVLENVEGYNAYKYNIFYNLASTHIVLGQLQTAKANIQIIEQMSSDGLVDESELFYIYVAKTKLFFALGEYTKALEQINNAIKVFLVENGVNPDDLLFTNSYVLKADILNALGKYEEAYKQAEQLYRMHKPTKKENHEIYGRIFTNMARSELGQKKVTQALDHIEKAISIFINDESRSSRSANYSDDPDLAASYVVQGDIFFAQNKLIEAIKSYRSAQGIYFYLYKNKVKGLAHISYLYLQGAKAACRKKDLYNYKCFGEPQIKEFGIHHPNTISMLEYCKQYDMDLWRKN